MRWLRLLVLGAAQAGLVCGPAPGPDPFGFRAAEGQPTPPVTAFSEPDSGPANEGTPPGGAAELPIWGACCRADGTCFETYDSLCAAQGGTFQGPWSSCDGVICPQPRSNETCEACAIIVALPFSATADTRTVAASVPVGSCNRREVVATQNDLWWCYTPPLDCFVTVAVDYSARDAGYDGITTIYTGADCSTLTELYCLDSGTDPFDSDTITFAAMAGETYWLQVGDWGNLPGGGETTISLDCQDTPPFGACCLAGGPCVDVDAIECSVLGGAFQGDGTACEPNPCGARPLNDACDSCMAIATLPFSASLDTRTAQPGTLVPSCTWIGPLQNDVWWCYTPRQDCLLSVDVQYATVGAGYDGITTIYTGADCASLEELACLDAGLEPSDADHSVLLASAGTTYWFQVGDFGAFPGGGETLFEVSCNTAVGLGACCLTEGTCVELDASGCVAVGGTFQGGGSRCAPDPCPAPPEGACCFCDGTCLALTTEGCAELDGHYQGDATSCARVDCTTRPLNDSCAQAIALDSFDSITSNSCCATFQPSDAICVAGDANRGLWYLVEGTGSALTASTCSRGTDFDIRLQVFSCSCGDLDCIAGTDDTPGCSPASELQWCSVAGDPYLLHVSSFDEDCGTFELALSAGSRCGYPDSCEPSFGRCCYPTGADTNRDGVVDVADLISVVLDWGSNGSGHGGDVNGNGVVDTQDLVAVILAWGQPAVLCAHTSRSTCGALGGTWNQSASCTYQPCGAMFPGEDCYTCTFVAAFPFSDALDTSVALLGAPNASCNNAPGVDVTQNDAWWCLTPERACMLTISVEYDGYDGVTAIYAGSGCDSLVQVACLDSGYVEPDSDNGQLAVEAGQTYWIQVGDWGVTPEGGPTTIELDCQLGGDDID